MSQRVSVNTCSRRVDGQYLITYRVGASVYSAISKQPIPAGTDALVEDGRAVSA